MKKRIDGVLRRMLFETGKASIAGFGTLVYELQSSVFDKQNTTIYPPSHQLKFLSHVADSDSFTVFVAMYCNISMQKAREEVDNYVEGLTNRLLDTGIAEIEGVGRLVSSTEGIQFEADSAIESWFTKGYTRLKVSPLKKIIEPTNVVIPTKEVSAATIASRPSWMYWLPFLLLFSLLTCLIRFYQLEDRPHDKPRKELIVTDTTINNIGNISDTSDRDSTIVPLQGSTSSGDTGRDYCIIITGYYSSGANVVKMMNRLKAQGFEVYTEEIGNGTRVGVRFYCKNTDLVKEIRKIRDSIARDAWYLSPSLEVKY